MRNLYISECFTWTYIEDLQTSSYFRPAPAANLASRHTCHNVTHMPHAHDLRARARCQIGPQFGRGGTRCEWQCVNAFLRAWPIRMQCPHIYEHDSGEHAHTSADFCKFNACMSANFDFTTILAEAWRGIYLIVMNFISLSSSLLFFFVKYPLHPDLVWIPPVPMLLDSRGLQMCFGGQEQASKRFSRKACAEILRWCSITKEKVWQLFLRVSQKFYSWETIFLKISGIYAATTLLGDFIDKGQIKYKIEFWHSKRLRNKQKKLHARNTISFPYWKKRFASSNNVAQLAHSATWEPYDCGAEPTCCK